MLPILLAYKVSTTDKIKNQQVLLKIWIKNTLVNLRILGTESILQVSRVHSPVKVLRASTTRSNSSISFPIIKKTQMEYPVNILNQIFKSMMIFCK